ncbi:hypothetical protein D4R42_02625 [bacterium]|nr:MAG: hypothetical protein D4R42_02625 [bacterium]
MSLTLNIYPENIDNSGLFNIVTSLSEDADHVNLRVRADITVSAVVVATSEKPKGLSDFDFFDILKANVTGLSIARDSGDLYKVSGGSPLVAYTILFTEVWEDADGTTTTGDTDNASGTTYSFVPAVGDANAFTEYVCHDSTCFFACKTLRNNITKFYTAVPLEYWIVFFSEVVHIELFYSKDSGAYDHATHFDLTDKWGVIIVNIGELMASVTSDLRIQLGEVGGDKITEVMTIYIDATENDAREVLEFDGLVGGKEYLAFEGKKDISYLTDRKYYKTSGKANRLLNVSGSNRQKLQTRFNDISNTTYLKSLSDSMDVRKLEASYAAPTEVSIISDPVKIEDSEMFVNEIEIEYED